MAIGSKVACVVDLIDCSVSHVFFTRESDQVQQQLQQQDALPRHRPVWISSGNRVPIVGLCGADWGENGVTLLQVGKGSDAGSASVMKHVHLHAPGRVSALAAHPHDPSLTLGMRVSSPAIISSSELYALLSAPHLFCLCCTAYAECSSTEQTKAQVVSSVDHIVCSALVTYVSSVYDCFS
jgi:hypothetical protein